MNATTIEKIEAYLEGQITKIELEKYASAQGIESLEEQIAWVRDVVVAVEAEGVKSQIAELLSTAKDTPPTARIVSMPVTRWIVGLAASLLLVMTAYFGLQRQSATDSNMYAQYEYQDPGLPVVMSQSSNYALYDALSYFGEQDYKTTIAKLSALSGTPTDTVAYYLGASHHYQKDHVAAIKNLQSTAINSTSVFQEKAQWLLVLTYLQSDNKKAAETLLRTITTDSKHKFHQQAMKLLQEM